MSYSKPIFYFCLVILCSANYCIAQESQKDNEPVSGFQPREKIIFTDNFSSNTTGTFPKGWRLISPCYSKASGVTSKYCYVQKKEDTDVLVIMPVLPETPGGARTLKNYIQPDIDKENYLPDSFTLEYDFFMETKNASCNLLFTYDDGCVMQAFDIYNKGNLDFTLENGGEQYVYTGEEKEKKYYDYKPKIHKGSDFGRWHHFALSYYKHTVACYVDERLILNIPDYQYSPKSFILTCDNRISPVNGEGFVKFTNVRLATGNYTTQKAVGDFNKILTEKKLVTHAILFDVNSETIRPASMAFLQKLADFLKEHSTLKLEISGHTDSDGTEANNLLLSQKRANEVKKQLISLGIKSARLTAKGYGATQPIAPNITEEDKANNRRVEFTQIKS